MFQGTGLGKGGGGGGHGGGGHGGGGHHGGGGGHGGGHRGGGGRGRGGNTVFVGGGGGGWGPGWYDYGYPDVVVVNQGPCAVFDRDGVTCLCRGVDPGGNCLNGLGDDVPAAPAEASMGSSTSWIAGGLILGLAVVMFAIDTKDPLGLKKAA